MVDKRDEDPYRNFSRKDLQILCKKYGLPANKSNSEMATSLILYLEKKNLSSPSKCKGSKNNLDPSSSASQLHLGSGVISAPPNMKGSFTDGSGSDRSYPPDVHQRDSISCKEAVTSDKVPREVENVLQLQDPDGKLVSCQPHATSSILSSVDASAPTLKFDVSCEDGIQLFVDLISSPSDWVQSLKSGIEIHPTLSNDNSQSLQQELGQLCCSKKASFQNNIDPDHEINDIPVIDQSEPTSTLKESGQVQPEDDRETVSLSVSTQEPFGNDMGRVENSGKDQLILSSRHGSDAKKEDVCRSESLQRDGESMFSLPRVNKVSQLSSHQLGLSSSLDGPRCYGMLGHPGFKVDACQTLPKPTYSCVNQGVELNVSPATFPMKMQLASVRPQNKDMCYFGSQNVGFVRLADQVHNFEASQGVLANSIAQYQDTSGLRSLEATDHIEGPSCSRIINGGSWDRVHMKCCANFGHKRSLTFNKHNRDITNFGMGITNVLSKRTSVTHGMRPVFSDPYSHVLSVQREPSGLMNSSAGGQNTCAMQGAASKGRDLASSHCTNAGNTSLSVMKQSLEMKQIAFNHPNELNRIIPKKHPTIYDEKWDVSNAASEREISEYYSCLMENTCSRSDDLESNDVLKRKREFNNVDDQNKFAFHDANLLRSSNHFPREINACPRRLTRFYSE